MTLNAELEERVASDFDTYDMLVAEKLGLDGFRGVNLRHGETKLDVSSREGFRPAGAHDKSASMTKRQL